MSVYVARQKDVCMRWRKRIGN